jgi:dTDP-4-amino-4,6-dideoxygalactose transaminase
MPVPLLDLSENHRAIRDEVLAALAPMIDNSSFILGPATDRFEASLARFCGVKHAVGVSSGTDALLVALMALDIQPGDEVIVPSFTFFATAGVVHRIGAKPVFVDIDPATFNIDPAAIAAAVTSKTRAIIPVHLFGRAADMAPIMDLAAKKKLHVIEDAAQAIGATDRGRTVGSIAPLGALSFYPTKNLGAFGDAGAVTTNDDDLAAKLKHLRLHGQTDEYRHQYVGGNFRIDAIQSAILDIKLRRLAEFTEARCAVAARYHELLAGLPVTLPATPVGHVCNQYTIRAPRRDALKDHLKKHGIGHRVYYPLPLHQQPCFAHLGYKTGSLPHSETAAAEVLSLPMYPELKASQQAEVAAALKSFYAA